MANIHEKKRDCHEDNDENKQTLKRKEHMRKLVLNSSEKKIVTNLNLDAVDEIFKEFLKQDIDLVNNDGDDGDKDEGDINKAGFMKGDEEQESNNDHDIETAIGQTEETEDGSIDDTVKKSRKHKKHKKEKKKDKKSKKNSDNDLSNNDRIKSKEKKKKKKKSRDHVKEQLDSSHDQSKQVKTSVTDELSHNRHSTHSDRSPRYDSDIDLSDSLTPPPITAPIGCSRNRLPGHTTGRDDDRAMYNHGTREEFPSRNEEEQCYAYESSTSSRYRRNHSRENLNETSWGRNSNRSVRSHDRECSNSSNRSSKLSRSSRHKVTDREIHSSNVDFKLRKSDRNDSDLSDLSDFENSLVEEAKMKRLKALKQKVDSKKTNTVTVHPEKKDVPTDDVSTMQTSLTNTFLGELSQKGSGSTSSVMFPSSKRTVVKPKSLETLKTQKPDEDGTITKNGGKISVILGASSSESEDDKEKTDIASKEDDLDELIIQANLMDEPNDIVPHQGSASHDEVNVKSGNDISDTSAIYKNEVKDEVISSESRSSIQTCDIKSDAQNCTREEVKLDDPASVSDKCNTSTLDIDSCKNAGKMNSKLALGLVFDKPDDETKDDVEISKKDSKKLSLKISDSSTQLIQSGKKVEDLEKEAEDQRKLQSMEEGEIFESNQSETSTDGEISDTSQDERRKKSKSKKRKLKSKRKRKAERDRSSEYQGSSSRRKRSRSKSRSPRRKSRRSRSRSRSYERRDRYRDRERNRRSSRDRRSRSREGYYRERYGRSRSRSRERRHYRIRAERVRGSFPDWKRHSEEERERQRMEHDLRLKIDKAKLRQIAIAKAVVNMQSGRGPKIELKPSDMAQIKAGGKSIDELTDYCKKIVEKEGEATNVEMTDLLNTSDDETDSPFINHPFRVNTAAEIKMNIRNAKQLPALSAAEQIENNSKLRLQFPVSSGSQHRDKEWVPVQPTVAPTASTQGKPIMSKGGDSAKQQTQSNIPNMPISTVKPPPQQVPATTSDKVFPDTLNVAVNIGEAVSARLSALRKLQENPMDLEASKQMYSANKTMEQWAQSKNLPGQFTGSTGVQVLTPEQLAGPTRNVAWAKKDSFTSAPAIKGGIGHFLLERMGWKSGQGLGKNNEGTTQPLMLDFKTDRKGLSALEESNRKRAQLTNIQRSTSGRGPGGTVVKDLSNKHPVSALNEVCNKRRWTAPQFIPVLECGPDHKKNFLFKVNVNGVEYQPSVASNNKKHAKMQSALVCLQELGLLPRDYVPA